MKRRFEAKSSLNGDDSIVPEKVFNDAVHGAMSFHPLCVKVIDTPQFQRLRFIKALGSCYLVFPAAAHNRFEHCLGVCHLAGKLVCAVKYRQPSLNISATDVLCVQLAGLCHDLGHGPFSHLWEGFMKKARPERRKWTHEEASLNMFDHLLETNNLKGEFEKYDLGDQDIIFIKELIGGPKDSSSKDWPYEGRPKEKAFLYEIVANKRSGVDVDKWDYFLRDSHGLGVKVTFDYNRIIKFSRVIDVEDEGTQICVRDKECDNLYDMFHTRRNLHRTAYQHRVARTIDSMILDAFLKADKHVQYRGKNGERYCLGDICEDMSAYATLTDDVFYQILRAEGEHPDLLRAQQILNNILTRKLYHYVGHTQPSTANISEAELLNAMKKNIQKDSKLSSEMLDVQKVTLNYGMEDKNPIEHIRFYSKNSPNVAKKVRRAEVSTMLPQSFQEVFFRVVCKSFSETKEAEEVFRAACTELDLKEPSVDSWPSHLTPVKHTSATNSGAVINGTHTCATNGRTTNNGTHVPENQHDKSSAVQNLNF